MSSFYVPDKIKPICQVCKYTFGAPVWIASSVIDEILSATEERVFGEEVLIDIVGTIPGDRGDINKLLEVLDDMKDFVKKLTSYKNYNIILTDICQMKYVS